MEQISQSTPQRPNFLTVLCILSFIGSAYFIYSGISTYFNADASAQVISTAMDSARVEVQKEVGANEKAGRMAEKMLSI
jgi:zona occludens toxin (predicted ATPase)